MALFNRQLCLESRPMGVPSEDNIRLRCTSLCRPGPGQVLIQNLYLSMDPAIRGWMSEKPSYMAPIELGEPVRGSTLGRVVESAHPDFQIGDIAFGLACNAWEDFSLTPAEQLVRIPANPPFPLSYYLSIFSPVGLTPYFGVLDIAKAKPGDTMLISAAAGAVGSLAGQIARIAGCRTVGLVGSDEKCSWIVDELGFDGAINYRSCTDLTSAIAEACPEGVDSYFDNVGGEVLDAALLNMNNFGRIVFCGAIAQYNNEDAVPGPFNYWQILARSLTVRGYMAPEFEGRFAEAREALGRWMSEGRLVFAEEVVDGLENTVEAFSRLFSGANKGKLMVKLRDISEPPPTIDQIREAVAQE
ncbi:MAG: NADP-dependent oxidoreductase, partial [Sulfitobacter sp. SK025]